MQFSVAHRFSTPQKPFSAADSYLRSALQKVYATGIYWTHGTLVYGNAKHTHILQQLLHCAFKLEQSSLDI